MITDPTMLKEKPVKELFADAMNADYDEDQQWAAIWALREKATPEIFQMAIELCKSDDPLKRETGVNVLGQFGVSMNDHIGPHLEERLTIVLKHLVDESENVVASAAWALSHMTNERAKKGLLTVRRHSYAKVRHAVAAGLTGVATLEAAEALLELMQDTEDFVRDWATFSLGREASLDSPQIRDALRSRLNDADADVRHEAIWGLAVRKDPIGIQLLLKNLEAEKWWSGDEDTAVNILNVPNNTPITELRDGLRQLLTKSPSRA